MECVFGGSEIRELMEARLVAELYDGRARRRLGRGGGGGRACLGGRYCMIATRPGRAGRERDIVAASTGTLERSVDCSRLSYRASREKPSVGDCSSRAPPSRMSAITLLFWILDAAHSRERELQNSAEASVQNHWQGCRRAGATLLRNVSVSGSNATVSRSRTRLQVALDDHLASPSDTTDRTSDTGHPPSPCRR
ncbi:hypothetical protein L227DRAFT_40461 [Lentinus tigrinus ALCF2SS1-6]|uniref:Uncharacterized protein n=1 Tax=Lentinus tigrinus ALCF2SS1-6 TaxID=1328759 RepID=A0A5C2RLR1_9APHY|nr:hypothetical protein L227DRAFT_40461 [Lentinus tigrinus ALCF2SS1-6]